MFQLSKLSIPLIQAPMAGGVTTPALVAAVTNAGGLGSFGFAYSTPEQIALNLRAARALTQGPINANLFVFSAVSTPSAEAEQAAIEALQRLSYIDREHLSPPRSPFYPDLQAMLDPIWQDPPAVLTFHFGLPPLGVIQRAHELNIQVGISVTSVDEGRQVEAAGADFIIAQGIEAGGHRGTFDPEAKDDEGLSVEHLVSNLHAELSLPVVAAGGIMTGRDIHRVLQRGAVAAQMGTAFLCCDESGTSPAHKRLLMNEPHRGVAHTRAFSGRSAQGLRNRFIDRMNGARYLPFPLQNTLTSGMRKQAVLQDDAEYQSLWAGTAYAQVRAMSAAQLMNTLQREYVLARKPLTD